VNTAERSAPLRFGEPPLDVRLDRFQLRTAL
jgi:hypothetical protein